MEYMQGGVAISRAASRLQAEAIRALILLGGVVRPTQFHHAIGRSLPDLPAEQGRSVLEVWCDAARILAEVMETPR